MKFIPYLYFFLLSVLPMAGLSQQISGNVFDSESGEAIAFATVYFSGTMIGTTTDLEGNFSLNMSEKGRYTLVVSYVGYQDFLLELSNVSNREPLRIPMEQEVTKLADVFVNPDPRQWEENYPQFEELFIGSTQNAEKVTIENPKDIFLFYDKQENALFAHAKEAIRMTNEALGYQLIYNMKEFEMDYRTRQFRSFGIPRFVELEPESKRQAKRWSKARIKAFQGSFLHFLSAVKDDRLAEEEFVVREVFRIPNPQRFPEAVIKERIQYFRKKIGLQSGGKVVLSSTTEVDSLAYWNRQRRMSPEIDSLGAKLSKRSDLMTDNIFTYVGAIQIIYRGEPEDPNYAANRPGGGVDRKQTSIVDIYQPFVFFQNNSYDVQKVFFQGYMGWSAKIAEMLPLEYRLPFEN